MATVFKREYLYQFLFFLCIGIPYLNNYELIFAVWSLTAAITIKKKYSLSILQCVSYFVAIFMIAIIASFFQENLTPYNYLRDIAYLLKPIIGLLLGYQLCKSYLRNPVNIIINVGIAIAVIHLIIVGYSITVLHVRTMPELREHSGYFSDYEVYALVALIYYRKFGLHISARKFIIGIVLLSISIFFYLARTNFIQFGILCLGMSGYLVLNRRAIRVMGSTFLVLLISYTAIYYYNPGRKEKGVEALLYKIKNAPIEPFKTRVNKNDWRDFNDNYRSYENILTTSQVSEDGPLTLLIGKGMGSSVDLKREVWLMGGFMRYIPFLHNGFMTVLLKSGLVGDLLLLLSILFFFKKIKSDNPDVIVINNLFVATGVFLFVSYWVFMGLYFVPDTKSVLFGFLLSYRELLYKKQLPEATVS